MRLSSNGVCTLCWALALQAASCCLAVGPVTAQTGGSAPPEVTAAQAALRAGDPDSAIRTLEGFFERSPNAVAGRLLLGKAYRKKGDLDKALSTYLAVSQPRPLRLQAMYSAAGIQALQGHPAEAFSLLEKLKASGAVDMDWAGYTCTRAAPAPSSGCRLARRARTSASAWRARVISIATALETSWPEPPGRAGPTSTPVATAGCCSH